MPLNQTAKYALRAMAILASLPAGEALPAKELARRTGIPVHYLSKIMRRLVVSRLVAGRRGHGGGFSLGRPARRISFADILVATDCVGERDVCAFGWGKCNPAEHCPLHDTYRQLQASVLQWMEGTTLAEVVRAPVPGE
ncbi:MAG: Rrf2 family transcriptional regulator [Planctomycetes bacterium]|nr:Rrf2 family transcriptional regulator [Planctomycetota bacterium]